MRGPPIRIRTFIVGAIIAVLLLPTLAGGAAWLLERDRQQAAIQGRLHTAIAYVTVHRTDIQAAHVVRDSPACSDGPICSGNCSSLGRVRSARSTSARRSARPSRRNRRASSRRVRPLRRPGPRRPIRPRVVAMTTGSSRSQALERRPTWSSTSTTLPPPVPPRSSSRWWSVSSSCSPRSPSWSGSPAAGWSRRSPG